MQHANMTQILHELEFFLSLCHLYLFWYLERSKWTKKKNCLRSKSGERSTPCLYNQVQKTTHTKKYH